jgi:hypothetical protein
MGVYHYSKCSFGDIINIENMRPQVNYSILSRVRRIRLPLMDKVGLNFKPCIRYTYHSFWLLVHTRIHNGLLNMEIASQI